jgi:hypothetical protein
MLRSCEETDCSATARQKRLWLPPDFLGGLVESELHAALLNESRTREHGWRHVQEIRVAPLFLPTYAGAKVGHPLGSALSSVCAALPPLLECLLPLGAVLLHRNKDSAPAIVYTARPGNIDVPAARSRGRRPRKVVGRLRRRRSWP